MSNSRKIADEEQKKIVEKAKKEISELAISISEKILSNQVDKESVSKAIKEI